jgi:hypothetical protein
MLGSVGDIAATVLLGQVVSAREGQIQTKKRWNRVAVRGQPSKADYMCGLMLDSRVMDLRML